jgi:lysophospholipase L1-like esterase
LVDLETLTKDWIQSLGDEPSKEMYLWLEPSDNYPEGRKDDTHLSEKGAHEIAKLAIEEMKKKELSISKHMK